MLASYKHLLSKRSLTPNLFLLEIIENIYNRLPTETPHGITELYESVAHPKPTFSIYRKQLSELEAAGCVYIQPSTRKASKKAVVLSDNFRNEVRAYIFD